MIGSDIVPYIFWTGVANLVFWAVSTALFLLVYRVPIYHPITIFLAYHFFGFVVRPFAVLFAKWSFIWSRIGFHAAPQDLVIASLVTNLGLAGCVTGILIALGRRSSILLIRPTTLLVTRSVSFALCAVALLALGAYSTYRGYGTAGLDSLAGFETVVDAAGGQQLQGISGYTLALAEGLPVLCIVLLLARFPRWIAYGVTALFVVLRLYVGAQRLSFVVVLAVGLFSFLISRRRRTPTITIMLVLMFGTTLFDFVGHDRFALRKVAAGQAGISELWNSYRSDRGSGDSNAMDVVEYETAAASIHVVRNLSGFSYGTQYLRLLVWPIPRQIWKSKPVFTSTVNLMDYGYNFRNLTCSLYADLFMAFGYPAVFLGMTLLGWCFVKVYEMGRTTKKPFPYVFFWIFLIYMPTMLRDGGITFAYFWGFSSLFGYILIEAGRLRLVRSAAPAQISQLRPLDGVTNSRQAVLCATR